jgi:hypothetical protein
VTEPLKDMIVIHDTKLAREFSTRYPFSVHFKDILGQRPTQEDFLRARKWASRIIGDHEWNYRAMFFSRAEDATLFKMCLWQNEPLETKDLEV